MKLLTKKFLSNYDLKNLSSAIANVEKNTSGEIRIVVRHRRRKKEKDFSLYELALKEFYSLGMHNTEDRTGVLIFLLVSERKFQILADQGINEKVEQGTWDRIAEKMIHFFKENKFNEGLREAIYAVGNELAKHFPLKPGDVNELPDDVIED